MTEFAVESHPSGVGAYITVPSGVPYRIYRLGLKVGLDGIPGLVMQGYSRVPVRYLDIEAPVGKELAYELHLLGDSGAYEVAERARVTLTPSMTYAAMQDSEAWDVVNPRDALVLYYATRLAQLARSGHLYVRNPDHKLRYEVKVANDFDDHALPVMAALDDDGDAIVGDMGANFTQSVVKVTFVCAAATREERDSLREAVIGLWRETDFFLEDTGMINVMLTNLSSGYEASDPPLHLLRFDVTGEIFTWGGATGAWQMLPTTQWRSPSAGEDVIDGW